MNIPNIVLHATAQQQLSAFVAQPSHAVLLSGPGGIGKTHIAAALAAALLQLEPGNIATYAYYRELAPVQGSITVENIRTLTAFFRLKVPGKQAIRRVAVLQDAETMGIEAQNALLKLLEEPPVDSVLILTSSTPQKLLTTIRSRVQNLQLAAPTTTQLVGHFVAQGHTETDVRAALLRAGTSVSDATASLAGEATSQDMVTTVKQALSSTAYDRLLLIESELKTKEAATSFVDTLVVVATASLEATAQRGSAGIARWHTILQAAHTAQDTLAQNGNSRLALTELMLAL